MSKKNRKNKIGHNMKDSNTREYKRKLSSLQELAGTILDKETPKESKFTGNLEDLNKEDLRAEADRLVEGLPFDANKLVNGILKEHDAGTG